MATRAHTTPKPARRRRVRAEPGANNVVPLHTPIETTAEIVADVQEKARRAEESILAKLQGLNASLDVRHRERAQECVPIGYAMDRGTLDSWIEIGQRMLGRNPRRGA